MRKASTKTVVAPSSQPPPDTDRSILDLVREIKSGAVDPKLLSPSDRQDCVALLTAEGASVAEIAQLLQHSDRTITRDRRALQEAAAIEHDPALAGRMAGHLLAEAELCRDRIRRVSRDRETPPGVKVEAERVCFEILSNLVQRLQSLGYLPTAAQRVEANLTHHADEVPDYAQIEAEAQRILKLASQSLPEGAAPIALLEGLGAAARRASLATQVAQAAATATNPTPSGNKS